MSFLILYVSNKSFSLKDDILYLNLIYKLFVNKIWTSLILLENRLGYREWVIWSHHIDLFFVLFYFYFFWGFSRKKKTLENILCSKFLLLQKLKHVMSEQQNQFVAGNMKKITNRIIKRLTILLEKITRQIFFFFFLFFFFLSAIFKNEFNYWSFSIIMYKIGNQVAKLIDRYNLPRKNL